MKNNKRKKIIISLIFIIALLAIVLLIKKLFFTTSNNSSLNSTSQSNDSEVDEIGVIGGSHPNVWEEGKFSINGIAYDYNSQYNQYTQNGWSMDLASQGYENGYQINSNQKSDIPLLLTNSSNEDAELYIGFINLNNEAQDITSCSTYSISFDNSYTSTSMAFTLPGGIRNGNTLSEVESIYGKPKNLKYISRIDNETTTTYTYFNNSNIKFSIKVDDYRGVVGFKYEKI